MKKSFNLGRRKSVVTLGQVLSLFMLSMFSMTCLNRNLITLLIFIFLGENQIDLHMQQNCKIGEITPAAASRC